MTASPKSPRIRDKKYRASFKIYGEHQCLITGVSFTEYSPESVDGAHIRLGCFSGGMKPSDDLILPLRHRWHMEFDRGQVEFIVRYLPYFSAWGRTLNIHRADYEDIIEFVKACARAYYKKWKEDG